MQIYLYIYTERESSMKKKTYFHFHSFHIHFHCLLETGNEKQIRKGKVAPTDICSPCTVKELITMLRCWEALLEVRKDCIFPWSPHVWDDNPNILWTNTFWTSLPNCRYSCITLHLTELKCILCNLKYLTL